MNSKRVLVMFVFLALAVFSLSFVSANEFTDALKPVSEAVSGVFETVFELIRPLLGVLLGEAGGDWDSAAFMGKILGLLVVTSIVYIVLSKSMSGLFGDNKWALWIISIVIPVLGFRFVNSSTIYAMALPSSTFAVAVTAGLPFILYFYLIESFPNYARRIAWVVFGSFFIVLYFLRYMDLVGAAAIVYLIAGIFAFVMVLLDGTIQKWRFSLQVQKASQGISGARIGAYQHALSRVHDTFTNLSNSGAVASYTGTTPGSVGTTGVEAYKKDVAYYEREIRKLI